MSGPRVERPAGLPADAVRVQLPYSEACMHLRVAGQRRWVAPAGPGMAQLYDDDGARLDALARAYETSDVAGGDREHSRQADLKYIPGGRYVLVLGGPRSTYRLRVCDSVDAVERAAAEAILSADSHRAVCYFDLDELAGDPPPVDIGDEIRAGGQVLHVIGIEHDPSNGRRQIIANADPDADVDDPDSARLDEIDRDRYEIVVRLDEDERMPVRYAVAEVLVHVVFNRRPEPA